LFLATVAALAPGTSQPLFSGIDKIEHCLAYCMLFVSGWLAFPRAGWHWRLNAGLLAYGATIELLQSFTGYRFMEFADLVANILGLGLGNLLVSRLIGAGWLQSPEIPATAVVVPDAVSGHDSGI